MRILAILHCKKILDVAASQVYYYFCRAKEISYSAAQIHGTNTLYALKLKEKIYD